MNNFQKTVYGLIVILFSSIIIGSTFFLPDYETVEIKDLELTTDAVQPEYDLGQSIIFNVYLTNNHPNRVKVPLPEHLTYYQVRLNHMGSVVCGLKEIEEGNQTVIIEPYTDHYLATFTYGPQRRIGQFELHIECENLEIIRYVKINEDSLTGVSVNSTGISLFLDTSDDPDNPTILIKARNANPYPVSLPVFYELEIHYGSPDSDSLTVVMIDWAISSWAIPENSTITLYDTNAYASEKRTPIYYTLYGKTLRYPPD
jgi:hypothetical protein